MAIYYIDPHTTTNGAGSWASPWSLTSFTRTGLADNDEIRIKGVALTSLLTATSYTATVTNNSSLTITAGGGLGADWAAGNVAYLPAFDAFFKVYSVVSNTISLFTSSSMLPINDWSTTSVTVQKVDTTTYPASTASAYYIIGGDNPLNNITVSDGWTSQTTQVTDGTVKSLFNSSGTSSVAFYIDYASTEGDVTGWTVDLQNTHAVCSRATSSGYVNLIINSSSATYNINQVYSWGSNGPGVSLSTGVANTTVNIETLNNYSGLGNLSSPDNTINVTNLNTYSADIFGTGSGVLAPNNIINVTNYSFNVTSNTSLLSNINSCKTTVNITGTIDQYGASPATYITSGYGDMTLDIGSGVTYYYNKRVSTKSSWTNYSFYSGGNIVGPKVVMPSINISNGWSYSTSVYAINSTFYVASSALSNSRSGLPQDFIITLPINSLGTSQPYGLTSNNNILVTFTNNDSPFELLGIFGSGIYRNDFAKSSAPIVTTDTTVYRTTGPSLKSYLETRSSALWTNESKTIKTIKIPCVSGTSYTVTGYIRTDDTAYTNGDCRVGIYLNDVEVTGQDMTTACENAWEQFTLTFTASTTGEYVLAWSMFYANGNKSYWLDDLTIV